MSKANPKLDYQVISYLKPIYFKMLVGYKLTRNLKGTQSNSVAEILESFFNALPENEQKRLLQAAERENIHKS